MIREVMSKADYETTGLSLVQRYEMLRKALADYLLLQVDTFITGLGARAIGPAMDMLTDKSAEQKVRRIKENGHLNQEESVNALSKNLADSMGETFNSDYKVTSEDSSRTVTLDRCGCIESVLENAERYGLTGQQVRSIFCGSCMGSYRKTASTLGIGFKGRLIGKAGCVMSFRSE